MNSHQDPTTLTYECGKREAKVRMYYVRRTRMICSAVSGLSPSTRDSARFTARGTALNSAVCGALLDESQICPHA